MARAREGWIAEIFSDLTSADVEALMRLLAKTKASGAPRDFRGLVKMIRAESGRTSESR